VWYVVEDCSVFTERENGGRLPGVVSPAFRDAMLHNLCMKGHRPNPCGNFHPVATRAVVPLNVVD
jgi:hypothetical protein